MKILFNKGHCSMFQLFYRLRQMFHVGEKNIPENSHKVDVQHPADEKNIMSGFHQDQFVGVHSGVIEDKVLLSS